MSDKYQGGILAGSTDVTTEVLLRKKTDNTGLTGIAFDTSGNIASYHRQGAARVAITLATQTVTGAHADGGFVEIDATNMPGLYRLDLPDAAVAAGVDYVVVSMVTTSGYTFFEKIPLTTNVVQSANNTAAAFLAAWFADPRSGYKGTGTAAGGDTDQIELAAGAVATLGVKVGDFIYVVIDGVLDGQQVQSIASEVCAMEGDWGPGTPDSNDTYYVFAGSPGLPSTVLADTFLARSTAGGGNSSPTVSEDLTDAAAGGGAGGGGSSNVNDYTQ